MTTIKEVDEQRAEILEIALKYDHLACWMAGPNGEVEPDENCLLVDPSAVIFLLGRYPVAYEDPNPPGSVAEHTRVVFPNLAVPS